MYFYCTTKIKNYYKVGITSSLDRIKQRLTTYRTTNPGTKIKFFSDIGSKDQDIEWSFKNKFEDFRIEKSECYKLDFEKIYKHFLKFQHKHEKLHHFWSGDKYYVSKYYFTKISNEFDACEFTEKTLKNSRFGYFQGFIPIADVSYIGDKINKNGTRRIQARILDLNKIDLSKYNRNYEKHLEEYFWDQMYGYINPEFERFSSKWFTVKKNYEAERTSHIRYDVGEKIFNLFEKSKYKSLIKKYPADPSGCLYWEKPEQKSITRNKSYRFTRKILNKFSEKYDLDNVLSSISSSIPRNDPKEALMTFFKISQRFWIRAPRETKRFFMDLEALIQQEIDQLDKNKKINLIFENKNKKNNSKKNKKYLKVVK